MTSCDVPLTDLNSSGDNLYGPRICWQPFIDWAWEAFDFDKEDWDQGFGFDDVCDNMLPLCRTLSAIWCLNYSAEDYRNDSYDGNILQWGCRFARNAIDELDARCGSGGAYARTQDAGLFADSWTQLYLPFFYDEGVSLRAGTLVHEARHADGKGHDSGGNDSSWEYNGAWKWQVCWGFVEVLEHLVSLALCSSTLPGTSCTRQSN